MKKVERYIKKIDESMGVVTRYYPFNMIKKFVHSDIDGVDEYFICPQCGEPNYRKDWDRVDEKIPRCLYCRNMVMELEGD